MVTSLRRHLALLAAASAVPAASFAGAAAASLYDADWRNALWLSLSALALAGGVAVSVLLARDLERMLRDLAVNARLLGNGLPLSLLQPALREAAAVAAALAAAAARLKQEPQRGEPIAMPPPLLEPHLRQAGGKGFAVAPVVEQALARLRDRAGAAGVTVAADLHGAAGAVAGDPAALGHALAKLVDRMLLLAPRGGVATLSAARVAGGLGIMLRWQAAAGMRAASGMVELTCGLDGPASLAEARAAIASLAGTIEASCDPAGETVAISLPLEVALSAAA